MIHVVEVSAWTFPSQIDEVSLVLIRPIADKCRFVRHSKCILGHAVWHSHSSLSAVGAPREGAQLSGTQGDST